MKTRDWVLMAGGVAFIILVVCLALLLGDKLGMDKKVCGCPKVISQNFVWLFIVLAVIFVGCLLYYLFSLKTDSQNKTIAKNIEILYTILDEDEKKVLKQLAENKGEISQSAVSDLFKDKIKAHRVLRKLIEKKIIGVSKDGKENKIILKEELRDELAK